MLSMDTYDENLAENKFLTCLKFKYKEIFEEAVSFNWIICVPKSDIVEETAINIMLDHVLNPISKDDNGQRFVTKMGNELILQNGYFIAKNEDKWVNILFEEMFYDSKLGKYRVVCIDNYLTFLFTTDHESLNKEQDKKMRNRRPSRILKNLRSINDFSDYIIETTRSHSTIDLIDSYIVEFLSIPLSTFGHSKSEHLRNKVQDIFDRSVKNIEPLNQCEAKIFNISIESYIIHNLYKILFEASTFDMAQNDEKLNRFLHGIKDLSISNFDIKISNLNWLLNAKYELAAVNSYKSPFGKLQCVKRSIECFESDNIISSDELLPILVFCIMKCNLSNWFANLFFIKTFHFCIKMHEEYSFILSSLEAALQYLLSGELNTMSPFKDFKSELLHSCSLPSLKPQLNNASGSQKGRNEMLLLHEKIKCDDLLSVKALLEAKETPETFSNIGLELQLCHPLCSCAKCKDLLHESYVQLPPFNINSVDEMKMTFLHVAAMHGSINTVEYLLTKGANFESHNITGMTPLHLAAYKGQQNVVLLLLNAGCDINSVDNEGNTALHLACIAGHDKSVKALIFFAESMGFPIGFNCQNLCGDTPLHIASRWGYSSTVKLLLNQSHVVIGCLDIKNKRNQTPIECAHNTAISSLLSESAISAENQNDLNLLILNFEHQSLEEEEEEFKAKSNLDTIKLDAKSQEISDDNENKLVLKKILKAIEVGDVKLAYFYLEINDKTSCAIHNKNDFDTYCHPLCQCPNCLKLPQVPVKCNLSLINVVGENYGVLHAAIYANDVEMCQTFLSHGANPLITTRIENQSCLHLAVTNENYEIMQLLIEYGADVNVTDLFGNTPLHLACIHGWKRGVTLLIDFGAKIDKNNKNELLPKDEAYRNGHMEIVGILVRTTNE